MTVQVHAENACVIPLIKDKNTLIMQHRNENIVKHF